MQGTMQGKNQGGLGLSNRPSLHTFASRFPFVTTTCSAWICKELHARLGISSTVGCSAPLRCSRASSARSRRSVLALLLPTVYELTPYLFQSLPPARSHAAIFQRLLA